MGPFLNVTGALADESRVRLLAACRGGERCVCQLIELVGLAPSTISKHLATLRQAGLLLCRKEGRWMHYRLPDNDAPLIVREALAFAFKCVRRDPRIRDDRRQLREILSMEPAVLCQQQRCAGDCCPPPSRGRPAVATLNACTFLGDSR